MPGHGLGGPTQPLDKQSPGALWFGLVAGQFAALVLPLACLVDWLGEPFLDYRKALWVSTLIAFPAFQVMCLQRVAELRRRNLANWTSVGWIMVGCFAGALATVLAWRYWQV